MKNFQGKVLLLLLLLSACNSYSKFKSSDFKKRLDFFNELKQKVNEYDWLKDQNDVDISFLDKKISDSDFKTLKKMHFKKIQKSEGVLIFVFSYKSDDNFIEKEIDKNLKTSTINKTYNHFLFYSEDETLLDKVSSYENYSECRKNYKSFNKYWRYSEQLLDCNN